MITTLIAIGAAAFGIVAGFFLGAWVRQDSIDGLTEANRHLRNELSLIRGNEARLQLVMCDLKAQLEDARELMN